MAASYTTPWDTTHIAAPRIFEGQITGPGEWTRADLREEDWLVRLPPEAVEEPRRTVATLRRQPVPLLALRPDSFDMQRVLQGVDSRPAVEQLPTPNGVGDFRSEWPTSFRNHRPTSFRNGWPT